MKVKPGYKQTNVGLIPEDWGVEPLGKRSSFKTGPFGSTLHQSDYVHEGIPVINPMHIKNGRITPRPDTSISEEAAQQLNEFRMKPGEIIIGRRGDMGRCATVNDHNKGWVCGTGSMLIRPRLDDPNFLTLVLSSPTTIKTIEDASVGSTMTNLNQTTLSRLNIQTPSIEEQRAIATAIGDIDAFLESLNSLITKKRAIKQATMQQLLSGETRLSGHKGKWHTKQLGELSEIRSGGTPSTSDKSAWSGEIPWCTPTDITALNGKKYLSQTSRSITEHGLRTSSAELIPKNSIIMTTRATIGECAINLVPMTTNQGFKNIIPSNQIDTEFLYYLLSTQKQKLAHLASGSTFLEIGKEQLRQITLFIPSSKEEQAYIANTIGEMDSEIEALNRNIEKNTSIKQAMMQELLTGRTRLI